VTRRDDTTIIHDIITKITDSKRDRGQRREKGGERCGGSKETTRRGGEAENREGSNAIGKSYDRVEAKNPLKRITGKTKTRSSPLKSLPGHWPSKKDII